MTHNREDVRLSLDGDDQVDLDTALPAREYLERVKRLEDDDQAAVFHDYRPGLSLMRRAQRFGRDCLRRIGI